MQRTAPGYTPDSREGLLQLLQERYLIPLEEWKQLEAASLRDEGDWDKLIAALEGRLTTDPLEGGLEGICLEECRPRFTEALERYREEREWEEMAALSLEILRFYGPVPGDFLERLWGITPDEGTELCDHLLEEGAIIRGFLSENAAAEEICDKENLEILLRMLRRSHRPALEPRPAEEIVSLFGELQGLGGSPKGEAGALKEILGRLLGHPARAELWEKEIFPARLSPYYSAWLDGAAAESGLLLLGGKQNRLHFLFPEDLPLLEESLSKPPEGLFPPDRDILISGP